MTITLPLMSALKALFFGRRQTELADSSSVEIQDSLVKLSRMVVVLGQRAGNTKSFQMMAMEINETKIVFKSTSRVLEGEMLGIEMLLQGHGNFKTTATVEWVLSSNKSYTGQLKLWTTPEQRKLLADYTQRQRYCLR